MCAVSMIIDHYTEKWRPYVFGSPQVEEIEDFKKLLDRAREYDKKNSEPECEMESKKLLLKSIADKLEVDISFVDAV